jgi:DNA invertase Pin-like site-specific DNA recombinase
MSDVQTGDAVMVKKKTRRGRARDVKVTMMLDCKI